MTPAALLALADACEKAPAEMQGRIIEEAWDALAQHSRAFRVFTITYVSGFTNNAGKFGMALEAHAYESAAMLLAPKNADVAGELYRLEAYSTNGVLAPHVRASAWVPGAARVYAATPALALTAASLRAHAALVRP